MKKKSGLPPPEKVGGSFAQRGDSVNRSKVVTAA
jgi:hypothetical protein